jgi:hypothetical protein
VTPPERLRLELQRLRARGLTFTKAWPIATGIALRDESVETALFWRRAWAQQRSCWLLSYSRTKWPRQPEPLFIPEHVAEPDHGHDRIVA